MVFIPRKRMWTAMTATATNFSTELVYRALN